MERGANTIRRKKRKVITGTSEGKREKDELSKRKMKLTVGVNVCKSVCKKYVLFTGVSSSSLQFHAANALLVSVSVTLNVIL